MFFRRCLLTLAAFAFVVTLALGPATARAQTPELLTDKEDYLPGEIVVLMGSGFEPGETVDVSIAIDDEATGVHIGDYDWTVELADDSGDFITYWTVPIEAYGMTLRATALGLTSSRVATVMFRDSPTMHEVYFVMTGRNSPPGTSTGGIPIAVNSAFVGFFLPLSQFGPVLVTPGSTVTYNAVSPFILPAVGATTTTSGVGVWTLVSISHASGFTAGPANASTTVVFEWCFTPEGGPATNSAPSFAVSDVVLPGEFCGSHTVTLTPADFVQGIPSDPEGDPVTVTFADGDPNEREVTFNAANPSFSFNLIATDNPSWRNPGNLCNPVSLSPASSAPLTVTVTANVSPQGENAAPVITSSMNFNAGSACSESVTVPIAVEMFGIVVQDAESDPYTFELSRDSVTLTLPEGDSDEVVSCPVVITVTDNPEWRECGGCDLPARSDSVTVYVSAHLHRNRAPTISAQNYNAGDIVGVLSGATFSAQVSGLTPEMFNYSTHDDDGDDVSVTADVSNVTLVGPGHATATVTLTAQDHPSGGCSSMSSSVQVQVTGRVIYNFDGPLAPLNWCISTKVQRGSVVPVRFRLFDANGVQVRTMLVNPAGGPTAHRISVAFNQASAPDGAVDVDEVGPCDDDEEFRYIPLAAWTYLLQTNSTYLRHTTYVIRIYTNDGLMHPVMISIK